MAPRAPADTTPMTEPVASTRARMVVGTAQHFRWLEGIVKTVLALNVADAIFTLMWIRGGLASEANPLLRELAHGHPAAFVVTKLLLVGLGSWVLWRERGRPIAVIAIFIAFFAYYALLLAHLGFLGAVLRGGAMIP
jgi:hypothetical protein